MGEAGQQQAAVTVGRKRKSKQPDHLTPAGPPPQHFRAGLDHLEFLVARRSDLDIWAARLDDLGIPHSGIKEPSSTSNSMITFRDPDNIQLEFFCAVP